MIELPENPKGWTKKMLMHINYGEDGGAATYEIFDADGNKTQIGWQYDTRGEGQQGFTLSGFDNLMTWAELREAWKSRQPA